MKLNTSDYYIVEWTQAGMKHKKEFPGYQGALVFAKGLANRKTIDQVLMRRSQAIDLLKTKHS